MKRFLFGIFLCFAVTSCSDDTTSYFPSYPVNFQLNLNIDKGHNLTAPGGYYEKREIKGAEKIGYGGVLVYHTIEGKYSAFDFVCPVEANRSALISAPDDKGIVQCAKCKSTFNLLYGLGTPESGAAANQKKRLKSYPVNLSGQILTVSY